MRRSRRRWWVADCGDGGWRRGCGGGGSKRLREGDSGGGGLRKVHKEAIGNIPTDVFGKLKGTGFKNILSLGEAFRVKQPFLSALHEFYDAGQGCFVFQNDTRLSIGLKDVLRITGLPINGSPVICNEKNRDKQQLCIEYLGRDIWKHNIGGIPNKKLANMVKTLSKRSERRGLTQEELNRFGLERKKSHISDNATFLTAFLIEHCYVIGWTLFPGQEFHMDYLPMEFPLQKGWYERLRHRTKITYNQKSSEEFMEALRIITEADIIWDPYKRLPGNFVPKRYRSQGQYCLTSVICMEKVALHDPALSSTSFLVGDEFSGHKDALSNAHSNRKKSRRGATQDWTTVHAFFIAAWENRRQYKYKKVNQNDGNDFGMLEQMDPQPIEEAERAADRTHSSLVHEAKRDMLESSQLDPQHMEEVERDQQSTREPSPTQNEMATYVAQSTREPPIQPLPHFYQWRTKRPREPSPPHYKPAADDAQSSRESSPGHNEMAADVAQSTREPSPVQNEMVADVGQSTREPPKATTSACEFQYNSKPTAAPLKSQLKLPLPPEIAGPPPPEIAYPPPPGNLSSRKMGSRFGTEGGELAEIS
ncbi:hypothetical protein BUALT_Bualt02G0210300 [Buddleja alternifolia]|uniref:Aminotransferase-like plant mobile domain-containing protein n=1 Tax=Buddleja alternifolia TaxID=168488 RepID=A0AAV6YCP5_9LAMI|nr:hypothetical protein BUALT_Bualt02G0210300 [Buddleja alternifolia]